MNTLATTANGYLDPITNSSDTLSGSITIKLATARRQIRRPCDTIYTGRTTHSPVWPQRSTPPGLGVTASVSTDANGSRLSLVSGTSGASGSLSVTSSVTDARPAPRLNYNSNLATGRQRLPDRQRRFLPVASNTVSNLIPGVTFHCSAPARSGSEVQVVIANDNSGVESTVNQFVTDYNSLISAINTQEGNDSSGTPEPLFGSPTLSLLQQQLLSGLNTQNPNGYLDSVSATQASRSPAP